MWIPRSATGSARPIWHRGNRVIVAEEACQARAVHLQTTCNTMFESGIAIVAVRLPATGAQVDFHRPVAAVNHHLDDRLPEIGSTFQRKTRTWLAVQGSKLVA